MIGFGFQLVEKSPAVIPDNPDDVNDAGDCIIGYLYIDDIELKKQPEGQEQCSSDPCSPTDGPIHTSYPEQVDNHSNVMVTGLDNVKSATNIKIKDAAEKIIAELDDRYCINGIDTIVWDGLNLAHGVYIWQMTLENDCGEQNYWKGFQYANDNLPIKYFDKACNNSIQTPIPCCESELDIYIEDETIEGPGELSFHAINTIEVDNTSIETNTENLTMKAGNKITLKPGTHIKEGAHAHLYIEPCTITTTHEALPPAATYPQPMANVPDEKCIEDSPEANTTVYPNPFSSAIYIDAHLKNKETIHCQILNMNGTVVFQKTIRTNKNRIKTSSFAPGVYVLKLISNNTSETYKIVKQ
ncbi:MAG: T9SS type A sorting domain-containing protein [Bacteroidales bacterium]